MKNLFNSPKWATKAIAGTLVLGMALTAQAQPGAGGGGGNRPNFQNMTPEERQQMMAQMEQRRNEQRQAWLKQAMSASGLTDPDQQAAVIAYMTDQDKTVAALRQQARDLTTLVVKADTPATDLSASLKAFRDAVAASKTKQTADLAALDAKVKYSTQPRVETLLTLLGVLGTETSDLGGIGEVFPDSPYGNRGGGFGRGGQGGRGGRGGGRGGNGGQFGGGPGGPGGPGGGPGGPDGG